MQVSDLWLRQQTGTFHVTIDGKQHNLKTGDKAEAFLRLADLLRMQPNLDLHTIRDKFLKGIEGIRAPGTVGWYRFMLTNRDGFKLPNWKPGEITDEAVQRWLADVPGNSNTKNGALRALMRLLNWAVAQRLIESNPVTGIQSRLDGVLPGYQARVVHLTAEQVKTILAAARKDLQDVLFILSKTGARPFEITSSEAKHLKDGVLVLPVERAKSRRKERRIVLHDDARELVEKLARHHRTGRLFRRQNGRPWDSTSLSHACQGLARELKIEFSAYAFRHTYITDRVSAGANNTMIAAATGTSTQMIDNVYAHPSADSIRDLNRNG
jgi:integrase